MILDIAFSPCPNDTLIFYGLVNKKIDLKGLSFREHIFDIETLNERTLSGDFHITKLSTGGYYLVRDRYDIFSSGSAMGMGCGPLLVAKEVIDLNELSGARVGIPGRLTTANLLFRLFLKENKKDINFIPQYMVFNEIIPAITTGRLKAGIIIHEQRFTYRGYGLLKIIDLGEWWQQRTSLPVPLGCICIKRELGEDVKELINGILRDSVMHGINHIEDAMPYIRHYSQELSEDVIRKHIELYVNTYTIDMGEEGRRAIKRLLEMAEGVESL